MPTREVSPAVSRHRLRGPLVIGLLFAGLLGIYLATISRVGVNTDSYAYSLTAWRIAHTGRPWMDGLDLTERNVVHFVPGRDGHIITTSSPGPKLVAAPFYLGSSDRQRDFSVLPASTAAALCTALAVLFLYLCLRGLVPERLAVGASAVLGLATPLWSVSANALWTHAVCVLGLAWAAWALRAERWWWAGAGVGFAMLGRPHQAVIAAVLGLWLARSRHDWWLLVRIGVPATVSMGLISLSSYYLAGTWDPIGGYGKDAGDLAFTKGSYLTSIPGFFLAPERGLLVWTPVLLVLAAAVVRGWSAAPDWTKALAVGGAAYTAVQIYVNPFGGDFFWAYRHGLALIVCIAPLVVFCAQDIGSRARAWLPWVLALQFAAIAFGSIFDAAPVVLYGDEWRANSLVIQVMRNPVPVGGTLLFLAALGWAVSELMLPSGRLRRLLPTGAAAGPGAQ